MTWYIYSWSFQLKSPLHVGFHKIMHFFRTRPYVPGKLLWGTLTAKLTPVLGVNDYQKIGDFLKKAIRFGYLYPYIDDQIFLPKYTENGLIFGLLSKNEFFKKFISSMASTSIDSDSLSADEGMLHELEFINPYSIDDGKPVFMKGLLWIKEFRENEINIIRKNNKFFIKYNKRELNFEDELANSFQLGGERKYGFGLLELKKLNECKNLGEFSGEWFENGGEVHLKLNYSNSIWSHASHCNNIDIKGDIEPIVGRDWDSKGSGRKLNAQHELFWSPGSVLNEEKTFKIIDFGLWVPCNSTTGEA
ncbi:MAG: hypothetical protein A2Y62_11495 [Candidatus Fischerbacteria bacterium RBG_13_37_8]|uniref:CRISPR type III-associated protein domain-containing protein n=1 Tax=Candidatus Fischerbacteria bacterium RBG_13_37_8 TaxID=1817863 RepID=A0A1F5VYA2_9BACT|nr:MAG: hypothetical protein A2Y62_11495 [Candidatus Fischerbacteria bacterium RBG_13_37_8]